MSMNQNGMETYMMKTTKRHLIILMTLSLGLLGLCNVSWGHVYWSPSGNNSNDGTSEAKAVRTWDKAKALIANTPDHWIVVCGTFNNVGTIDGYLSPGHNAKVIRKNGWGGTMFSGTITTSNVTIDGRCHNGSYASDAREIIISGTTVTINAGTVIQNNRSTGSNPAANGGFGAIWITNGGVFVMNGGTIQNCTAKEGGALFAGADTQFFIHGGTIKNCSTTISGGAISLGAWSPELTIDGGIIENCHSPKGGAVFVAPRNGATDLNATITMSGGTIRNCNDASIVDGAAFYVGSVGAGKSVTLTLSGGTIDNCDASSAGGGVYCSTGVLNLTLSGTTIKNCDASRGGGIYVYGAKTDVKLSGGVIEYCSGSIYGGGIYANGLNAGSSFTMDNTSVADTIGCVIRHCSSKGHAGGAGVFLCGSNFTPHFTKGSIHDCRNEDPDNADRGRGGGLLLGDGITAYIDGDYMKIYNNYAKRFGGGIQLGDASTLNFSSGRIYGNETTNGAAGIHVTAGSTLNMSGGNLYGNVTLGDGGGIHCSEGCTLSITGGKIYKNIAHTQGGGININTRCNLDIPANSTLEMYGNEACRGGAIMVDGAKLTIRAGSYHGNKASDTYSQSGNNVSAETCGVGGAFCLVTSVNSNTFASEFYLYDGDIYDNTASSQGGGIYMGKTTSEPDGVLLDDDPEMYIYGGTIIGNQALNGNGGGVFLESGTFEMTAGSLEGNSASQYGGAVYITEVTGRTMEGEITGGNIGSSGNGNSAACGGGIYADGGTMTVNYGSGASGMIQYNYASSKGGGLYISSTGKLNLIGNTTLQYNRVSFGGCGGGVYLEGIVQAGHVSKSGDAIKVENNYADEDGATITDLNRNNIYLPNPTVNSNHTDVITVVEGGLDLANSSIGFSVSDNFVPVIYCASTSYLKPTILNTSAIFEDSHSYEKYYTTGSDGYDANHVYLAADTWVLHQSSTPSSGFSVSGDDVTVSSKEGLAWLISYVNNFNGAGDHTNVNVTLTADIDMSDHKWVPIGYAGKEFTGTFDGGGHTITGINCSYIKGTGGTGTSLGLFGATNGASIHDVFVTDANLMVRNQTSGTYSMGGIVGSNNGTVYNCTASSNMESTWSNTTMGGLVGKLTGGTIHSSAAMSTMTGYTMGGLAGTNAGNIYNSFANPQFTHSGSGTEYMGGLVAVNTGQIENCYSRVRGTIPTGNFGYLAGANHVASGETTTNGTLTYCYAPTEPYTVAVVDGIQSYLDCYNPVIAPYKYDHGNDNTLVTANTSNLLDELNRWVEGHSGYSPWKRTTAGGYSTGAGNINGDYPIHKYSDYKCVASTDGINLDYAPTLDAMLTRHTSNATINLYAHDRTTASTGNGVVVYIDENVSLLQDVGEETVGSVIEAYTSQTLPGNPRSWHFLSSSLTNSGIGFNYGQNADFNWEPNPCHVTISNDDDAALFPSDLPMSGGYADVARVDLYAFYEPEYHWINLKRNSNSHWHMNATTEPIAYTNETTLTPGKGYLVSIDKDQLLQNRGTLNNGEVEIALGYTPAQEWAGLVGYNLIGNPYQSYLDFPAFASQNSGLWYDGSKGKAVEPTYAVYDDAMGGYIQYKEGASRGSKSASGILNMHQGFMVRSSGATRAKFTNAMRTNEGNGVSFRGEQPAYPLINLTVTDDEGVNDFAVLELGRDRDEGAEKLRANDSKGWLYLHHGSEDYGILFRSEVDDYQPLWFEADEAGSYTLSWETANAEFEALTLVDNITGVVTDMLAHDRYTFEATPEQYASRFKIVIGDYKDMEENDAHVPVEGSTFAYVNNGNIVLTGLETEGEASLQIIDMTGRVILCRDASHASVISTDGIASGIYVLRLTDGKGTKIQKIVIE